MGIENPADKTHEKDRIDHLDALRGVAIIMVVLFHGFSRWNNIEPWPQNNVLTTLFSKGYLGVDLFFIISGYVIFWSLERSRNFRSFIFKRWLRLFPAMAICTVFIFVTGQFLAERPLGVPNWQDTLTGLLFLKPNIIKILTFGQETQMLDGVFWSLYVEITFYIMAAFAFFKLKDKRAFLISGLYLLHYTVFLFFPEDNFERFSPLYFIEKITDILSVQYFGWFCCGIYFYQFQKNKNTPDLILSAAFGILAAYHHAYYLDKNDIATLITGITLLGLFYAPFYITPIKRILCHPALLYMGFISYPLYLLHQNFTTGSAIKLYNAYNALPGFMYPAIFICVSIVLAWAAAQLEPKIKTLLRNIFRKNYPFK